MKEIDVAIIGAGPAGCSAAIQCKRLGLSTVLIEKSFIPGGLIRNANEIENLPALEKPLNGIEFTERLVEYLDRYAISPLHTIVSQIKRREVAPGFILVTSKATIAAKVVIVACGTIPYKLNCEKNCETGNRVFHEVADIPSRLYTSATIIGAGDAAFDYALTMEQKGCDTINILCRSHEPKANIPLQKRVSNSAAISLYPQTVVTELRNNGQGVTTVTNSPKGLREFESDIVLVAIGRYPAMRMIEITFLFTQADSIVTSERGFFVVGDARLGLLGQVSIAFGDGMEAAMKAKAFLDSAG